MNNRIIDALSTVRDLYGDGIFYNHTKTKNLLHDLSPDLRKERIQIANFLEMNGYFQLKYAGRSYPIIRGRLIQNYVATYAVSESTAAWVVDIFGALLGYTEIKTGAQYQREQARTAAVMKDEGGRLPAPVALETDMTGIYEKSIPEPAPAVASPKPKPVVNYAARIAADLHSVAVTQDGRVLAAGLNDDGQCNTFAWSQIVAVSAGSHFTVGLKSDGTVVAAGRNDYGQCNVRSWTEIVAISAGARHTLGLRADGSVLATGQNKHGECNVYNWRNIIRVVAGYQCTFGIKKDHRVLVKGNNKSGDITVSHLSGVKDITHTAPGRAVALLRNGTLGHIGPEEHKLQNFAAWTDIRQIAGAPDYFAGLRADGTVRLLAYYWEDTGVECGTDDWRDIIAIAAGRYHILGLRKDGTLAAVMMHPDYTHNRGQCNVKGWEL